MGLFCTDTKNSSSISRGCPEINEVSTEIFLSIETATPNSESKHSLTNSMKRFIYLIC